MSRAERAPRTPLPKGYWTIWTTVALDLIGFGIVVPILGVYAERFGASGYSVGWLFATFSLAQLVCAPLLGRLSDRIGRKPVIVISLVGTAVGSFVTGAAGALWVLFLGRVIDGASGGSLSVAQAAVADIATPAQRPKLVGMLGAAFGVGFVLGPAIGGLAALGGPHVPFYVAAALAAVNAVAAAIRLPETRTKGPAPRRGAHLPQQSSLRRLALIGFLGTLAFAAFEATFSLFGSRRFDLTEGSTAVVFLGIGLVLVAVQGGGFARLAARVPAGRLYPIALGLVVAGLAVVAGSKGWPLLIVGLLLLSVGQGLAAPSLIELVNQQSPPERRGEALGFQQSSYAVGRVLGPPLAGSAFDRIGVWSPMLAGAVVTAGALALVLVWRMPARMTPPAA
ncbi:MAG: MFS transporter [Actinomycetota bacterium]|nr:MFS transporter [Actinomycetota bacterium]